MADTEPDGVRSAETSDGVQAALDEASQQDVQGTDESSRLRALDADIRDQDDLERDITRQVRQTDMFIPHFKPI